MPWGKKVSIVSCLENVLFFAFLSCAPFHPRESRLISRLLFAFPSFFYLESKSHSSFLWGTIFLTILRFVILLARKKFLRRKSLEREFVSEFAKNCFLNESSFLFVVREWLSGNNFRSTRYWLAKTRRIILSFFFSVQDFARLYLSKITERKEKKRMVRNWEIGDKKVVIVRDTIGMKKSRCGFK